MTTLHINVSDSVTQKVLAFLDSLSQKGEEIEIIDDKLYRYEKKGIVKGLEQLKKGEVYSSDELLKELSYES